ncbi:hypothetical protein M758_10G033700 [Ceratodon purpureus]|nr:hypothetical protein M758_10G033700 [Ceratodon purpureus]
MAGAQLERSASSVRESMAAFQRSASSVKVDLAATPILPRTGSALNGDGKLKLSPSMSSKDVALLGASSPGIRNRNIVIGLLSTLLILAVSWHSFSPDAIPAYEAPVGSSKWSHGGRAVPYKEFVQKSLVGAQKFLVQDPTINMKYHGGPLLTGTMKVHVIFYGYWAANQKTILTDFIKSFAAPKPSTNFPTVAGWWSITKNYKDKAKTPVAQKVVLGKVVEDKYSFKKNLKEADIEAIVAKSLKAIDSKFVDPTALYVVVTSPDVNVQGFCSSLCGTHSFTRSPLTQHKVLPFVWVGNPSKLCPGHCAWPYAKADYGAGPNVPPLKAPNGDVGVDGMTITLASMIVGAATNTRDNGYYQGDTAYDGYEAVAACGGIFGDGAYPGYAGKLLKTTTGASYNVNGVNGKKFLVPFMFNIATKKCAMQ